MNPFEEKPQKIEKSFQSWNNVLVSPYDKQTVDPYTRLRVILMNGTEFENVWFSHQFSRATGDNELRRQLALLRRSEQQHGQYKRRGTAQKAAIFRQVLPSSRSRFKMLQFVTVSYHPAPSPSTASFCRREKITRQ